MSAMSSKKTLVTETKSGLNKFKTESASEVGVNLKKSYNGNITSKQAGSVVKKMVEIYEQGLK